MNAIFFDLDGTLLHFEREYRDLLAAAIAECEPGVEAAAAVSEATLEAYHDAFFERFRACEPEPVRSAFATLNLEADPDALARSVHDREVACARPPENAATVLERLSADPTCTIGILTNGVRTWQLRKLRATGLDAFVDAFVSSYDVGAHKPDPAVFRYAETQLPADAYVMVGDADSDVEGARTAGWGAHRYEQQARGLGDLPDALEAEFDR